MWPAARGWLAWVAVVYSACSLVVDLPDKAPTGGSDSGIDGGPNIRLDAAATDARPDSSPDTSVDSPALRCMLDAGKACDPGQRCTGQGASARCVDCLTSADCTATSARRQCVANKCVACDRGALPDSPSDDVGCSGATPICGADNKCIACDDSSLTTQCTPPLKCNPGVGCSGCKLNTEVGKASNGCGDALPICRDIGGSLVCDRCMKDLDCKFREGQGYCALATGLCFKGNCNANGAVGANGCLSPNAPFCKPAPAVPGGFDCAGCGPGDCTGSSYCAATGPNAGACVQCRVDAECPPKNGQGRVCDTTNNTCRNRTMSDCAASSPSTPVLDGTGTCVQCLNDMQCPRGQYCNPPTHTCGQCTSSDQCPLARPTCNPTNGTCEAGCSDPVCALFHAPATLCNSAMTACVRCRTALDCGLATPLCSSVGTCVECTQIEAATPVVDDTCARKSTGTACIRTGLNAGRCGQCEPGGPGCAAPASCNPTTLICQ